MSELINKKSSAPPPKKHGCESINLWPGIRKMLSQCRGRIQLARGFTLLEVAIAITILLVGIFSIVKIFPLALKVNHSSEQATIAANLGQAKIEEVFYLDYDNINVGTIEAKHRLSADTANPFYYYQRQTVAQYVDSDLNPAGSDLGLKKITVTVFWQNPVLAIEENWQTMILITKK